MSWSAALPVAPCVAALVYGHVFMRLFVQGGPSQVLPTVAALIGARAGRAIALRTVATPRGSSAAGATTGAAARVATTITNPAGAAASIAGAAVAGAGRAAGRQFFKP